MGGTKVSLLSKIHILMLFYKFLFLEWKQANLFLLSAVMWVIKASFHLYNFPYNTHVMNFKERL